MRQLFVTLCLLPLIGCRQEPADVNGEGQGTSKGVINNEAKSWPVWKRHEGPGAQLWEYCVPYQPDIQKALDELREREFKAGRFYRSELRPKTKDDAIRNAGAPGTRSVLDIERISAKRDIEVISPAPEADLRRLFGTHKPTRAMVESASKKASHEFMVFLETYGRVEGVYMVLYSDGKPVEIYFAGWSAH